MKTHELSCPHCTRPFKTFEKNFSVGMAKTLVSLCRIYQGNGQQWVDWKGAGLSRTDIEKLTDWGFINAAPLQGRQKRPSLFTPSTLGWNFATGGTFAPTAAVFHLADDQTEKVTGFGGHEVNIRDILKSISLESLWSGAA